jgi:hypothetical protein
VRVERQRGAGQRPFLATRLHADRRLRDEVTAATRLGISRRRYLGWEPRRITTHEHDEAGRLIRSVTTVEPEWDAEDRGMVAALQLAERDMCGCGQPLSESAQMGDQDPEYEASGVRCKACEAVHRYLQQCTEEQRAVLRVTTERKAD